MAPPLKPTGAPRWKTNGAVRLSELGFYIRNLPGQFLALDLLGSAKSMSASRCLLSRQPLERGEDLLTLFERREGMPELSPTFLSFLARRLFVRGSFLIQLFQWYRPFICPFEELIARVPVGSHVLDVGCGEGLFLGLLRVTRQIAFGYGFDNSPQAITIARRMAARVELSGIPASLMFEHQSVTGPWPDRQFDVVSIVDVMHHLPSALQRRLLKLAIRRIKPGGLLLYKDMVCRPRWRAIANRLHDLLFAHQCVHYVQLRKIQEWATDAGLELIEARTINRLWYGHELCVFRRRQSKL